MPAAPACSSFQGRLLTLSRSLAGGLQAWGEQGCGRLAQGRGGGGGGVCPQDGSACARARAPRRDRFGMPGRGSTALTSCPPASPAGVRTEQDLYVRLIDSVTKQVSPAVHSVPPLAGVGGGPSVLPPPPSGLSLTSPDPPRFPGSVFTAPPQKPPLCLLWKNKCSLSLPSCPVFLAGETLEMGVGEQRDEEGKQLLGDSVPPKHSLLQEICPHQGKLFSYYFARVNQATAQVLCCQRALPRK